MMDNELRLDILRQVESGELNPAKASELLRMLEQRDITNQRDDQTESMSDEKVEVIDPINQDSLLSKEDLKKPTWAFVFWLIPVLTGALITVTATSWLYQSYTTAGLGFSFWISWIPFLLGIGLIYFGIVLQQSKWIHIHIRQPQGQKPSRIIIGFPVPVRFLIKMFYLFRHKLPDNVQFIDFDLIINALDENISSEAPVVINVDDDDGSKVEIYFG